jgi:hypothetical protein
MASRVKIANRALQKCGISKRLGTFEDDSQTGRAIRDCFTMLVEAELQRNLWTFSTRRVQLSPDTDTPVFGYSFQYSLPSDFLRICPNDPKRHVAHSEHQIEGRKLLNDQGATLNLRYVRSGIDEETWHPLFAEGMASRVAHEIIMELKANNTKKDALASEYIQFMADARKANAIEHGPIMPGADHWETVRADGLPGTPTTRST